MRVVLIGYRGSGKSTLAKRLARLLGWSCVDTDHEIEARSGKDIATIFQESGEAGFRALEHAVVRDFAEQDQLVLATGGGAVLWEENRPLLKHNAFVVWLRAKPEVLHSRITADKTSGSRRPALTSASGTLAEVIQVLALRTPIYQACADLVLDTDRMPRKEQLNAILTHLQEHRPAE